MPRARLYCERCSKLDATTAQRGLDVVAGIGCSTERDPWLCDACWHAYCGGFRNPQRASADGDFWAQDEIGRSVKVTADKPDHHEYRAECDDTEDWEWT